MKYEYKYRILPQTLILKLNSCYTSREVSDILDKVLYSFEEIIIKDYKGYGKRLPMIDNLIEEQE